MGRPETATSAGRSRNMAAIRRRDTAPEWMIRRRLHALGLRYRVDLPVTVSGVRTRPDLAFTRWKLAVFVDGCFWHACPDHFQRPLQNVSYWEPKIDRNVERDRQQVAALEEAGWRVLRIWEHVEEDDAVSCILRALRAQGWNPTRRE